MCQRSFFVVRPGSKTTTHSVGFGAPWSIWSPLFSSGEVYWRRSVKGVLKMEKGNVGRKNGRSKIKGVPPGSVREFGEVWGGLKSQVWFSLAFGWLFIGLSTAFWLLTAFHWLCGGWPAGWPCRARVAAQHPGSGHPFVLPQDGDRHRRGPGSSG